MIKSVFIMTDLEGVSGVVSFSEQAYESGRYYEQAKKLLSAEINAAIEGMLEEGVEDIIILDAHGPGGICFEMLHPAAKLIHGRPLSHKWVDVLKRYEASIMIGQHAMCGTPDGNLNHTQCSRDTEYYKLNGQMIGETAQFCLLCGGLNIPMIFLSGDTAACRETEALVSGITTAAVKEGLSRGCATSLAQAAAHKKIKDGARRALQKQAKTPLAPLKWPGPYTLEKRYLFTDSADGAEKHPLFHKRIDAKTVQFHSDDILKIIYS
ncbi:MAG: hypothetical protein A2X49_00040 [Lentisphaerae bacterium GWF2_52_8]|nr:MAG: hypothetical protein A2X49_00040 [Lentisphaerae bacterium GWF2_52_8]